MKNKEEKTEEKEKFMFQGKIKEEQVYIITGDAFVGTQNKKISYYECPFCSRAVVADFFAYCPSCGVRVKFALSDSGSDDG